MVEYCLHFMTVAILTTVIFQQIRMETDQVKMMFAMKWMKCAGRITVYTGLTGRFFACMQMVLGRTCERVFGSVRFLFERYQAGWISQQKLWNRQAR